ncbi:MAG: MFS transporter, partial [Micromonosporaceae bacterium]|nr:MFS transporter [Micromonosporaceae bacterium]
MVTGWRETVGVRFRAAIVGSGELTEGRYELSTVQLRAGPREWVGLVVLALPAMLIAADLTVLHLAVPQLGAALSPSTTQLLWIVDIYGFGVAGLLITMGTLGDRIGRRRLLLIGSAAFGAASVLAAYATSAELLIGARALLGVTGATLLPSTLSLITNMFRDDKQRRIAIAVWSTSFLLGGAVGPLVGGLMLEHFWWGSIFLLAVPIMLVLLVAGPLVLPESREPGARGVDPASVVLLMAAILSAVYGIKELASGASAGIPLLMVGAGAGLGWWFVRRQRRLANPVLDLTLFARRRFSVSLGAQFLSLFALAAIQFLVMQYLQLVLGLSALEAGLWILPAMAAGVVGNLLAPALARALSQTWAIVAGLLVGVAGAVMITQAGAGAGAGLTTVVVGFALLSLGLNPVLVLAYDLILGSVPAARAGTAAGTAETGNELGIALGVATAGSIGAAIYRRRVTGDTLP